MELSRSARRFYITIAKAKNFVVGIYNLILVNLRATPFVRLPADQSECSTVTTDSY